MSEIVSVPCRGTTFLNDQMEVVGDRIYVFPSPVGELHFSRVQKTGKEKSSRVSVPCRGTTFLKLFQYRCAVKIRS